MQALQQAAGLFGQGQLTQAEAICREIVGTDPQAVEALNLLSLIRKRSGDVAEAESLMRRCVALDPRRPDISANLGNLLAGAGRTLDAESAYRKALGIDKGFRPARLGLARLLVSAGRSDAAVSEARRLIEADENDAEAWNVLGSALRQRRDDEEAEAALRKALELRPDYAVARHNLGALLAQLSRSEEALEELDRASIAGVRSPELDFNRASALMDLARFDEAEQVLLDAVRMTPCAAGVHTLLARLRFMRGAEDYDKEYRNAVTTQPDDLRLRFGYTEVLRGAGRFDDAIEVWRAAEKRMPDDAVILAGLAATFQDACRFDDALHAAQKAKSLAPDDTEIDDILIDTLTCLGRADEAMPLVSAGRRRKPLNQWYVAMEATVARLRGDPRYEELYDYERFVRPYALEVPEGWSSLEEFHTDLTAALKARHQFVAEPLDQSIRLGTQTPRGLLGDPDPTIQAFLRALEEPVNAYREVMGQDPSHPLSKRNHGQSRMIGCWSVRLKRGGFHVNHVHSEGWISSAYYVEVPPEVADKEQKSGWIKFGEPRFPVPGAAPEKYVQPEAGRLVLFPSYMWHGTTPITGDEPRMTIAFDVVPGR